MVVAAWRARLRFGRLAYVLQELARHLVHADHRAVRVVRALVDGEHAEIFATKRAFCSGGMTHYSFK